MKTTKHKQTKNAAIKTKTNNNLLPTAKSATIEKYIKEIHGT